MSYLLLLIYTALLLYLIVRVKFYQSTLFSWYIPALIFALKFLGGISVYLVYAKFYGTRISSDIFKYFDDGNIIFSALHQNPLDYFRMITGVGSDAPHLDQYYHTCHFWLKEFNYGLLNDNRIVIRFNAIVRLLSMGNIHIHTLFMSFLSFTGLWGIFKIFEQSFLKQRWLLVLAVFFMPSVYFWTSGILKEGLLMFSFGMLLYFFSRLLESPFQKKYWVGILLMFFLLLISKFYVLVAALPGLIYILLTRKNRDKYQLIKFIGIHLLFLALTWFSKPVIGLSFPEIIAQKQNDFISFTNSLTHVGSKIDMEPLKADFISIVKASPKAFYTTLFRPTIFEISNPLMALAAVENFLIVLALLSGITFFNRNRLKDSWLGFCISFTLILFVLSGLTTPVLGALVRYKAPALPFLGIALMYVINFEKLNKFTTKLFKFV